MTDQDIEAMVSRFLQWPLPPDFAPDGGISFKPTWRGFDGKDHPHQPVGTNLLNHVQAKAMILHVLGLQQ